MSARFKSPLWRPVVVTLALLAAYSGYETWLTVSGARKMTADAPRDGKAHFEIVANFAPEAFHVTRIQDIGRVIEVRGSSIFVMDVRTSDARQLARNYWIAGIKPWKGL
jgi:hypothetical protein